MPSSLLTVDLGNTSSKLRLWDGASGPERALLESVDVPAGTGVEPALAACLERAPKDTVAVLSSVAAGELEARVAALLTERLGPGYLGVPPSGLEVLCADESEVGDDRLFAARGAIESLGASAIVVDVGTALTVDAVELGSGARAPRFHGGAIAPGPALLAAALAQGAARLPRVDPGPNPPALGRDTRSAIEAGIVVGLCGAAAELARRIGAESGLGCSRVALTGGARRLLLEPPFLPESELVELPELVHVGLCAAALDVLAVR